jgi:hypothetical protein
MNDNRTVYGYLSRAFNSTINDQGKIDKGLIKVLFEEVDNTLYPINTETHFDDREEVFLLDGFESLKGKYQGRIIKLNVIANTNNASDGQTKYVAFKNQITDINKNELCSFIKCPLPDPLNLEISLPSPPRTKIFYIVEDDNAYGPFLLERLPGVGLEVNECVGKLRPLTGKSNGFPNLKVGSLYKFHIDEVKHKLEGSVLEKDDVLYLTDSHLIHSIQKNQIEFITQQHVVDMFTAMANKRLIPSSIVTAIKKELNSMKIGPSTREAVTAIVESAATSNDEWRTQLFNVIEKDEKGKKLIDDAVATQQIKYEKQWLEKTKTDHLELEKLTGQRKDDLSQVEQQIISKNRELFKVEQDIQQRLEKLELESGFNEELQQKRLKADEELESKRNELDKLNTKYRDLSSVERLSEKLSELRDDIKGEQRREITLEDTLKKLKKEIREEDSILQARLREMVPYVSSIIQAPMPSKNSLTILEPQEKSILAEEISGELASNIVNSICTQFNKNYDRDYGPALIASILVAYHQNFMTIFSGSPGVGKTSFVRILTKILNTDNRFKEVAVGRAWTSDREFIGFYNSLTDNFSPAPSGIYQYLKGIEHDDCEKVSTQIVLLDEANLSPIEHYASVLLNVADTESSKEIPVGKESVKLPKALRVIGTVNHDMTTEPLSARLLDRAPVIPFDINFDNDDVAFIDTECDLNYSSEVFLQLFGSHSKLLDKTVSDEAILPVIDVLKDSRADWGVPFIVSKRKQINIKQYIEVLTPVLLISCSLSFDDALILACDYATLYFLLPPINGNGSGIESRLKELQSVLHASNLTKSETKLEDMINRGKYHLDTFNYFNY